MSNKIKKISYLTKLHQKYRQFIYQYIRGRSYHTGDMSYEDLQKLSNAELLSLMRHESHRIEKTVYNNILQSKNSIYRNKRNKLRMIYQLLEQRNYPIDEPTIIWSKKIYDSFDSLEQDFIQKNSISPAKFDLHLAPQFIDFLRTRRSVRVWSEKQPSESKLNQIAHHMIEAAKWAPTSGNRQPWRFLILIEPEKKQLLKGIKESHCTNAPLLLFIGMDTRFYGALGKSERSIYIDAGAAIMQMVLVAHKCGLGACWNHFADDLIDSREVNQKIYTNFTEKLNIPEYIAPIAIIATGIPEYIPPEPARMKTENLLIDNLIEK